MDCVCVSCILLTNNLLPHPTDKHIFTNINTHTPYSVPDPNMTGYVTGDRYMLITRKLYTLIPLTPSFKH